MGQSDAVKAFEDLKLQELEAKQQTSQLGSELRKLQRSGSASAEEIENVSRSMVRAQQSSRNFARRATQLQMAQAASAVATIDHRQALVQLGSTISEVGSVLSRINPELGRFGATIGSIGAQLPALTGTLGQTAQAMAIMTLAVDVGTQAWDAWRSSVDEATRDANEGVASFTELARRMRDVRESVEAAREATDLDIAAVGVATRRAALADAELRVNRLREDGSTAAFQAAEAQRIQAQASLDTAVAGEREISAELSRQAALRSGAAAEERRLAEFREQNAQTLLEQQAELGEQEGRGGGSGGGRVAAEREAARAAATAARQIDALRERRAVEDNADGVRRKALAFEIRQTERALQIEDMNQRLAIGRQLVNARADNVEAIREFERAAAAERQVEQEQELQAAKQRSEEIGAATTGIVGGVAGTFNNLLGQTIGFIQEGGDLASDAFLKMLDSFLEATAVQYTILALAEVGQAIASFAQGPAGAASGAAHLAAAAVYGAVAAATGAAGAVISVPTASSGPVEAAPVQAQTPLANGGGTTNVTNLFAPQAVFTEAERGEIINGSRRAQRREQGSGRSRA